MQRPGVPLYFGSSQRRLFGMYHPSGRTASDHGVVICAPLGLDFIRAHPAFQRLAVLLADRGVHVFRFDYYGCGDSAGRGDESIIGEWQDDVRAAIEELRDMSGAGRLSIVGSRLGGALAALQAQADGSVDRLALWDPVVRGRRYLERLQAMHAAMLMDPMRFAPPREADRGAYRHQLMGFPLTPAQRESIVGIDLTASARMPARHVLVAASDDRADYRDYAAALRENGVETAFRELPGVGDWEQLSRIEHMLFPVELVNVVVEWLTEGR